MRSFFAAVALTLATASFALAADPSAVKIDKKPADIQRRSFDLKHPPREMGPMDPGDDGLCDTNFQTNVEPHGSGEQTDATHGKMTIDSITVTLQLDVIVWVPNAPPKGVRDHEEGHRQISEFYYKNADAMARKIAEPYIGKQFDLSGPDLRTAMSKILSKLSKDISDEIAKQWVLETTQARYDAITDHSRRDIPVPDAIAQAIKETAPDWTKPTAPQGGQ